MTIQIDVTLALVVAFLWGVQPHFQKMLLTSIPRSSLMVLSGFLYFASTLVFLKPSRFFSDVLKLNIYGLLRLLAISVVCGFFANRLYYVLLEKHSSLLVSTLVFTAPLFTALIDIWNVSFRHVVGTLLTVAGVIIVSTGHTSLSESGTAPH